MSLITRCLVRSILAYLAWGYIAAGIPKILFRRLTNVTNLAPIQEPQLRVLVTSILRVEVAGADEAWSQLLPGGIHTKAHCH